MALNDLIGPYTFSKNQDFFIFWASRPISIEGRSLRSTRWIQAPNVGRHWPKMASKTTQMSSKTSKMS